MDAQDRRRFPRRPVSLAVVVSRPVPSRPARVVDLSEGGARLAWTAPVDVSVGSRLHLAVQLPAGQGLDLAARVVRIDAAHIGLEFDAAQRSLVQQVLAEAQSPD